MMGATVLVEIYRTQEIPEQYKFNAVVTISYFGTQARLHGLSGNFSLQCWKELRSYLTAQGITEANYIRRGKHVVINRR